ncbi:hypothetical protein Q4595_11515 [Wenyingzhuangia sp. 1_MG-2023]|nr:hypothetical protein [Wenyingzhuangia sp. 1_MG-2023]
MIILRRYGTNPITMNLMISSIMGAAFGLMLIKVPEINLFVKFAVVIFVFLFFLSLLYLAQRRFLNIIKFSETDNIFKTENIYNNKKTIKIENIETISFIESKGLKSRTKGFKNKNLCIKTYKNLQPQIFEIEDLTNYKIGITIVRKIIEKYDLTTIIYFKNKYQLKPSILKVDKVSNNETTKELEAILNNQNINLTIKR